MINPETRSCIQCGKDYIAHRNDDAYCSGDCYKKHLREAMKKIEEADKLKKP